MKKIFILPLLMCANAAFAVDGVVFGSVAKSDDMYGAVAATDATNESSFFEALKRVRKNCMGISDELGDIRKLVGVSAATAAGGTLTAAGAAYVGGDKMEADEKIKEIKSLYSELANAQPKQDDSESPITVPDGLQVRLMQVINFEKVVSAGYSVDSAKGELESEKAKLEKKSKLYGNVRTGLMATSTAANIASAVVSGTNANSFNAQLSARIGACLGAVNYLSKAKVQAGLDGTATNQDVAKAEKIIETCGKYNANDVLKLVKQARGASAVSGIGAATGLAGTITSATANSNKIRDAQSEEAQKKEENLNTASNVLATATTVASFTSSVLNVAQLSAAARVIELAEQCEEALK